MLNEWETKEKVIYLIKQDGIYCIRLLRLTWWYSLKKRLKYYVNIKYYWSKRGYISY